MGMLRGCNTIVYAARTKDRSLLMSSSSGGMFTVLSDWVLTQRGAIVCSVYNYKLHCTEFALITDKFLRDEAKGSKYMQSDPKDIYIQSADYLKENPERILLFIGMGCQAASYKKFVEGLGLEKRVYVVDIVCHGSPSPEIWNRYICSKEYQNSGKARNLRFKDKRNGWKKPTAVIEINGKEHFLNDYVKIFYNKSALRPSCYKCPYASIDRDVDMTIGDFWGIENVIPEFYDPMGNSLVLIHSDKGKDLFEAVKDKLDFQLSTVDDCLQPNLIRPTEMPSDRDVFWEDYQRGINYIMKKYGKITLIQKVRNRLKYIMGGKKLILP